MTEVIMSATVGMTATVGEMSATMGKWNMVACIDLFIQIYRERS